MMTSENALPGGSDRAWDMAQSATAEVDGQGLVVAWTRAAERLLGYPAEEVLHRPAAELLAMPGDEARVAAVARWCRSGDGWGGSVAARHRDGRDLQLAVQVTPLLDGSGQERWSVLALEEWRMPGGGVNQLMLEPFLAHAPVGMAVLDTGLRYVWVNDVLERLVPLDRRLGKRVTEVLPKLEAEAFEERMQRVLKSGAPVLDYEFRSPTYADPHQERAYSASFFVLEDPGAVVSASGTWSSTSPNAGGPRSAWLC